jgi:hypothetical protein
MGIIAETSYAMTVLYFFSMVPWSAAASLVALGSVVLEGAVHEVRVEDLPHLLHGVDWEARLQSALLARVLHPCKDS